MAGAARWAAGAAGSPSGTASPAVPIIASPVPACTVCPSGTTIRSSTPLAGEGISVSTLSVFTSSSGSNSLTDCPSAFSHFETVPSTTDSPSCGMVTWVGMSAPASGRWSVVGGRCSTRRTALRQTVHQGIGHLSKLLDERFGGIRVASLEVTQFVREGELRIHLSQGTECLEKELPKLARAPPRLSLGDIGRHRHGGALHLTGQSKPLVGREPLGNPVGFLRQLNPLLPHNQVPVVPDLHVPLLGDSASLPPHLTTDHSPLTTAPSTPPTLASPRRSFPGST